MYAHLSNWAISFQDPATPTMEAIIHFHHHIMFFIVMITVGVFYFLAESIRLFATFERDQSKSSFYSKDKADKNIITHAAMLEVIWTITPSIILFFIALPSFTLLYAMEQILDPSLTVKVIGHQWYWSYEYSDFYSYTLAYDSYMIQEEDLLPGELRLLTVDASLILPVNTYIRLLITSDDVLHSWAVPSLGIKMDAVPGRLNQVLFIITKEGTYYGQCSEICGVNHSFMPISVVATSPEEVTKYLKHSFYKYLLAH